MKTIMQFAQWEKCLPPEFHHTQTWAKTGVVVVVFFFFVFAVAQRRRCIIVFEIHKVVFAIFSRFCDSCLRFFVGRRTSLVVGRCTEGSSSWWANSRGGVFRTTIVFIGVYRTIGIVLTLGGFVVFIDCVERQKKNEGNLGNLQCFAF